MRAFLQDGRRRRALVLAGGPGIGKTTLWEAGIGLARDRGMRVLRARPTGAEAQPSFAALADLLDGVDLGALAGLPYPQRAALDVALLRAEPAGVGVEPHAIALGLLATLRVLASCGPLLVAIDDVQWLDHPSADALTFAARRLDEESVGFLLAKRPGGRAGLEQALDGTLDEVTVGPLSLGATRRLLSVRLGLSLPRQLLRRIVDSTLGNPLFALELGRSLVERALPEIGDDLPVPDAVEEMLGTRVTRLRSPVRRLLLAVALSADLRTGELAAIGDPAVLEDAVDDGLLLVDGDRVRASHPLIAAVAKQRSKPRERRALHGALAKAVADRELRALHLALATVHPDPALAIELAAAAARASARGAREHAVQLAEHALRLTSAERPERAERLLELAGYLEIAGEPRRVTDLLVPELDALPRGAPRARAWLLLSEGGGVRDSDDYLRHLESALEECESDAVLRAHALAKKSSHASAGAVARIPEAEAWALEAVSAANAAQPGAERHGLDALAWARAMRGRPIDDLCELDAASVSAAFLVESPQRVAIQRLVWRGQLDSARVRLSRLRSLADERCEPMSYALQRLHGCELELRAGDWDAAARLLDEWAESADRELLLPPMYERCRALLAAGRGRVDDAERWAADAIASVEASGFHHWDLLEALRARGIAALFAREPRRALPDLLAVWEHTEREGVEDPGVFPVVPDLVEALTEVGEIERARALTARLGELAERQRHPWGLATTRRCIGLLEPARDGEAEAAAEAYERLGLRFDAARTWLARGRAQRRRRKWRAARDALERAVATLEEIGSTGWAAQARSELERVGARRPRPAGELTPAEQRVAELASGGMPNKQIARVLFVTVHTVEAHLSHAYAKLGVRSRGQLAGRLPKHSGSP